MTKEKTYRVDSSDQHSATWVHIFPSQIGWIFLEVSSAAVKRLSFGYKNRTAALDAWKLQSKYDGKLMSDTLPTKVKPWIKKLVRFAEGIETDLTDIPLDLSHLSDFGKAVTNACQNVTWGQIVSYKDLALQAGSPQASRAVGGVMARNRFPLIVPCHRITASNGKLTGFSAPGGISTKQKLLHQEQAGLFN